MTLALPADPARAPAGARPQAVRTGIAARPWWPAARRALLLLFFGAVLVLLWTLARELDWPAVGRSLRDYPARTLLLALALGAASHLVYTCYDLIGRHVTGHALSTGRVMAITWLSYAFNLNFGAMVGGVGFRARLYTRQGLDAARIAQIFTLSLVTNWLGYFLLAAVAFVGWPLHLPPDWALGVQGLQMLGGGLALLAVVYVGLCAKASRRSWQVRGHTLPLPSARLAVLQCVMGVCNWSLMASMLWVLLGQKVAYGQVLSCLLLASGVGLVVRVPGGVGVTETVFVALLREQMPVPEIIAALVAYRALYFVSPLLLALPGYAAMEWNLRRAGRVA